MRRMDRPVGEREDLWSWRKVKEDHAPPRPVYPSGTHPQPPHLSEPVSGKPYCLVEPPRRSVNEQTRGHAKPLSPWMFWIPEKQKQETLQCGRACDMKAPQQGSVHKNMLPWTMSLSFVLEDRGANKQTHTFLYKVSYLIWS